MLTLFAALIPILGTIVVGMSTLQYYGRLNADRRAYDRVCKLTDDEITALGMPGDYPGGRDRWDARRAEINERHRYLLECNGLPTDEGSYERVRLRVGPPSVPVRELVHQWILFLSAAVGLVLLAVDQL